MKPERSYTVADAILDTLEHHGVTTMFGYPGGAILPFYDALPSHPSIQHILVRNEQGAAFMAQGYARSTKKIGVCCATSGPGATNLVTGIADAFLDSVPLLAITGQVPLKMIGKDMFQEVDTTGITMPITKHNYLVDDPLTIVRIVTEAIAIASSGRPGPVLIDVPKDIMAHEHPRTFAIPTISLEESDPSQRAFTTLNPSIIDQIFDLLSKAERPILLVGQGVKYAHAEAEIVEFINKLGIPTVSTILAKGVINSSLPLHLGMLGMHGYYHCNMAMHHADLIINIGSRFDDRIVGRYDVFGKDATIIHIDIDASELNKLVKVDVALQADAKNFLRTALASSRCVQLSIDPWRTCIRTWKDEHPYIRETPACTMRSVLADLDAMIRENPSQYILAVDVGQHQMWASLSCSINSPTQWLCSGGSGTMGFALPAAIGASFGHPEKTVICLTGDGGIQMNIQELGVLSDHRLNVKVCILNNQYLGMVRQWQELFYQHNYSAVAITSPDFPTIARAYGLEGLRIEGKEKFSCAQECIKRRGPAVIEYRVEMEENVFPMVPAGKHLGETITQSL